MTNPLIKRGLWIAVLLLLAGVAVAVWRGRAPDSAAVFYGNIDIREVTVGFRVAGRVATLGVDEGDAVRAGQELGRLDATPLELELNEARASAAALGRRLALLQAGFRPEDVAQGRATVAERRAALRNAEVAFNRQEALRGTGAVAQRAYDEALAARDEARARLAAAEANLAQLERGYRVQEIAEGEANHKRATAVAAQAEQRLGDAVLLAPADGVVVTRAVEPGTILAAGTPVLTLSLRTPVWARIYVAEPDLGRVVPGNDVLIYTDTRPDHAYHGRIGFVSPTAEFTPKNVETPDLRTALVYRARIVVTDPDPELRQGMPVTVRLAAPQAAADRRGSQ